MTDGRAIAFPNSGVIISEGASRQDALLPLWAPQRGSQRLLQNNLSRSNKLVWNKPGLLCL
jgi:hypothetical protein